MPFWRPSWRHPCHTTRIDGHQPKKALQNNAFLEIF